MILLIIFITVNGVLGEEITATCKITPDTGMPTQHIEGLITLKYQTVTDEINIVGEITGFDVSNENNAHGFHIHKYGKTGSECKDAGGHFNPFNKHHGAPSDTDRHIGDLGNILAISGKAVIDISDSLVKLDGPFSVIGKSIVVHEKFDDFVSQPTGNAGGRLGCCIITAQDRRSVTAAGKTIAVVIAAIFLMISGFVIFKMRN